MGHHYLLRKIPEFQITLKERRKKRITKARLWDMNFLNHTSFSCGSDKFSKFHSNNVRFLREGESGFNMENPIFKPPLDVTFVLGR